MAWECENSMMDRTDQIDKCSSPTLPSRFRWDSAKLAYRVLPV